MRVTHDLIMHSLRCQRYLVIGLIVTVYYNCFGACISNPAKGSPVMEEMQYSMDGSCDAVTEEELNDRFVMMNRDGSGHSFLFKKSKKPETVPTCRMTSKASKALAKKALHFKCALLAFKLNKEKCNRGKNQIEAELEKCRREGNKAEHINTKYNFDADEGILPETTNSKCYERGSMDGNELLRLCTECESTRILGPDRFPSQLIERSCSSTDTECLVGDGECIQQRSSVLVLQRTGRCMMCNGSSKEEWVPELIMIDSGCSCGLRPGSVFSLFL